MFAEHYLRWERGDTTPDVKAGVAATASHQLARLVLSARPRIPPALDAPPPRARLLSLHGELAPLRRRLDVRVELARGRARWGLQLVLRRSRQRWLVTRVHD